MAFVKLDCGIVDSSLWVERDARSLFLTALVLAQPYELTEDTAQIAVNSLEPTGWIVPAGWYGLVRIAGKALIARDGCDMETGLKSLVQLGMPDMDSRSTEHEGRRLVRINDGYLVLNYFKYRDRDHSAADRMRRMRNRRKKQQTGQADLLANTDGAEDASYTELRNGDSPADPMLRNVTQAESRGQRTEAEADTERSKAKATTALALFDGRENGNGNGNGHALATRAKPLPALNGKPTGAAIIERLGVVLDEIRDGTRDRLSKEQTRQMQAGIVFAYWQAKFDHARSMLDKKRETLICKRLEENGGDVSELLYALDGALRDEWVMGTARNSTHKNDGIDYLLRDRAHVEQFAGTRKAYREGKSHPQIEKFATVLATDNGAEQNGMQGAPIVTVDANAGGPHDGARNGNGNAGNVESRRSAAECAR